MYGDRSDAPPTELELEEERAGYEPEEPGQRAGLFDSPLWIAGIGPGRRRRREPTSNTEESAEDPGSEPGSEA